MWGWWCKRKMGTKRWRFYTSKSCRIVRKWGKIDAVSFSLSLIRKGLVTNWTSLLATLNLLLFGQPLTSRLIITFARIMNPFKDIGYNQKAG